MPYSPELCAELRQEFGENTTIYGCSGDGTTTLLTTTTSTSASPTQPAQPMTSGIPTPGPIIHGPADDSLAIVLATVLPISALTISLGLGKAARWLEENRPGEFDTAKKWLKRVGFCFWVLHQIMKFFENCKKSDKKDPEAMPMAGSVRGEENTLFSISYKNE